MRKKRFLSLLAAVALACALVGCQADTDTGQVDAKRTISQIANVSESELVALIEEKSMPNIRETNENIFFDNDNETLYYRFKDGETVNLNDIENTNQIKYINILPLDKKNKLKDIIGFEKERNTDNIKGLNIENTIIDDFAFIKTFDNLLYVDFTDCNLKNTLIIGDVTSITNVSIKNSELDDFSFLSCLPYLNHVHIERTIVESVPNLKLETQEDFHSISLSFIECGQIDISGISSLENYDGLIYRIDLSGSKIKDFSPLATLSYISQLNLCNTSGSTYDTINQLKLGTLWLDNCNLSDISFLSHNNVGTLSLSNNNIYDWSPLLDIEGLFWCWTFDNPIIIPENIKEFEEKEIFLADSKDYAYPY